MIDVELPTASPAGALTRGFSACLAPVTEVPVTELPLPAGDLPQWIAVVRTPNSDPTGTTQAGGGGGRRIGCREGPAERYRAMDDDVGRRVPGGRSRGTAISRGGRW